VGTLKVHTEGSMALKEAIAASGWIDGEVVAVGQLRQGKAPSTLGMVTGAALIEVIRPRRSKALPRHFALVVTPTEVLAFKAGGGSPESSGDYEMRIEDEVAGRWPRPDARLTDLDSGARSRGGTLELAGESIPVARPNLDGDPSTDELFGVLSGA
jgi:hypothetical protein